jgi:hypothetical protein
MAEPEDIHAPVVVIQVEKENIRQKDGSYKVQRFFRCTFFWICRLLRLGFLYPYIGQSCILCSISGSILSINHEQLIPHHHQSVSYSAGRVGSNTSFAS